MELAIKHALQHCSSDLEDLYSFAATTRNNDQTRRVLESYLDPPDPSVSVRLPRHGDTRWSSIYRLLHRFIVQIPLYDRLVTDLALGEVSDEIPGLTLLEKLMDSRRKRLFKGLHRLLEPIAQALDFLQADSYPTLPFVQLMGHLLSLNVDELLGELDADVTHSRTLENVAKTMKKELLKRFKYPKLPLVDGYVPVDYLAAALDPRTLSLPFMPQDEHAIVWEEIARLGLALLPPEQAAVSPTGDENAITRLMMRVQQTRSNPESRFRDEINRFRSELQIALSQDSLAWWKAHCGAYPTLAKLARVRLLTPYLFC